ncbi:N-acetylmuramoyl-L-alanine amidase [Bacillus atrophaeus]|uniref:N-acetylmuramoyl-L-alanine amidase n=1 Tax=Bacillus atrophaeus TaxID=1452 RepID=UPI002E24ED60|nr:N-acetylmuramoyl-L-alanine amidase [Bacillus atrophaeus]
MLTQLTNGMKIGKATVVVDIIPKGNYKIRPGTKIKPTFLTYHNTGNSGRGANAKSHNKYIHNMANLEPRDTSHVSWHLTVDDEYIYQHIPFDENAWHTGDGSGPRSGNMNSVGIEICMHVDQKDYHQAEENAIALGVYLAKQLGIPDANHWPHQKWSGKYCPQVILDRDGSFNPFHTRIKNAIKKGGGTVTPAPAAPTGSPIGTAEILVANLNIRASASFSASVVDVAKKGQKFDVYETKNGLHRIKTGWISAGTSYSKFTKKAATASTPATGGTVIGTAEILVGNLNIRSDANFSAKIVGVAKEGQKFNVYETKNGLHRTKEGWFSAGSKYVKFTKKTTSTAATNVSSGTAEVLVSQLNIRSAADFNSGVVDIANKGQKFPVYETKNGLYRIGNGRWISAGSKYTKFTRAAKGDMKTGSIVDYLKSIGVDASLANRKKLASQYGVKNYSGSAAQNAELLKKMRG